MTERFYRLCVLDNGIWYVVRAGNYKSIQTLRQEYIDKGYLVKTKPNFTTGELYGREY